MATQYRSAADGSIKTYTSAPISSSTLKATKNLFASTNAQANSLSSAPQSPTLEISGKIPEPAPMTEESVSSADAILAKLEQKAVALDKQAKSVFNKDQELRLREIILSQPGFQNLIKQSAELSGNLQTRLTDDLGEPSAEIDPRAQVGAAQNSRAQVATTLAQLQGHISTTGENVGGLVEQLTDAQTQQLSAEQDSFDNMRNVLDDIISVEDLNLRKQTASRRGSGGSGGSGGGSDEVSGTDEAELLNLALASLTEEERKQISLLPTATRKSVLLQIGRDLQSEQGQSQQGYQAFKAERGLDKYSLLPEVEKKLQDEYNAQKNTSSGSSVGNPFEGGFDEL